MSKCPQEKKETEKSLKQHLHSNVSKIDQSGLRAKIPLHLREH